MQLMRNQLMTLSRTFSSRLIFSQKMPGATWFSSLQATAQAKHPAQRSTLTMMP